MIDPAVRKVWYRNFARRGLCLERFSSQEVPDCLNWGKKNQRIRPYIGTVLEVACLPRT